MLANPEPDGRRPRAEAPSLRLRIVSLAAAALLLALVPSNAAQAGAIAASPQTEAALAAVRSAVADYHAAGLLSDRTALAAEELLAGTPTHAKVEEFHRLLFEDMVGQLVALAASPAAVPEAPAAAAELAAWNGAQWTALREGTAAAGPCEQACGVWFEACIRACGIWVLNCLRAIGWWWQGAAWCLAIYAICIAVCYALYYLCVDECKRCGRDCGQGVAPLPVALDRDVVAFGSPGGPTVGGCTCEDALEALEDLPGPGTLPPVSGPGGLGAPA